MSILRPTLSPYTLSLLSPPFPPNTLSSCCISLKYIANITHLLLALSRVKEGEDVIKGTRSTRSVLRLLNIKNVLLDTETSNVHKRLYVFDPPTLSHSVQSISFVTVFAPLLSFIIQNVDQFFVFRKRESTSLHVP